MTTKNELKTSEECFKTASGILAPVLQFALEAGLIGGPVVDDICRAREIILRGLDLQKEEGQGGLHSYLLRLSPEHARAIAEATELYERIAMGQTRYIGEVFEGKNDDWQTQRNRGLNELLDRLQGILFPDLTGFGHSYGIMNEKTGRTAHLCYEVNKELVYRMAWTERPVENTATHGNQYFRPSLFPSGVVPRPQCAAENGKQPELAPSGELLARELEKELGTTNIKEALQLIQGMKQKICELEATNANLEAAFEGQTFYHADDEVNKELGRLRAENAQLKAGNQ